MNLNKLKEEFTALSGEGAVDVFFAPGRVNLIGEHIDTQILEVIKFLGNPL